MTSSDACGEYGLMIQGYFASVASQVEFLLEKELTTANYFKDKAKLEQVNAKKAVYLKEINQCSQINLDCLNDEANLARVKASKNDYELRSNLFRAFCFLAQFRGLTRLISTDIFLSDEQIAIYSSGLNSCAAVGETRDAEDADENDSDEEGTEEMTLAKEIAGHNNASNEIKAKQILSNMFDFTTKSVNI
jgi:hypothetical protein